MKKEEILARRRRLIGAPLSLSYAEPLHIVRGQGAYLYDAGGRAYLDCVNNVCHVGHSHPRVVEAAARQMADLNTNTRYLHENLVEYAERLTSTMRDPLSVCFFTCSGSEANDLALRIARVATGRHDAVVVDGAYHGTTAAMIELSPYKFNGPGGPGRAPHVHLATVPDLYRGAWRADDPDAGTKYAAGVEEAMGTAQARAGGAAVFFAESALGCGGQIILPDGYLKAAYHHVRDGGGLCVADEVQVGFGRVGTPHWWAFETQGVTPDIVTLGKPMGNGHPLAAVVTTPDIAAAFDNGMEYFNTYGGNPVSCAVGLAVLDVIEEEGLRDNAAWVGEYLVGRLQALAEQHELIGDVRGLGLFIGVELVRDRDTLEPAAEQASSVVNHMVERGVLLSTDGPLRNVLKIKPPIVFSESDADLLVENLSTVLGDIS
jgi:4-aminobutyrate aminotransferase-like enzyme